jgi:4-hydroxy-tetrahydrodipicolinate synthase
MLRDVQAGRLGEAIERYWRMQPAVRAIFELQAPLVAVGGHPWQHMKYFQWCVGGNGGLVRDLGDADVVPELDEAARQRIHASFEAVGIVPAIAPQEQFPVGRAAHARGVRREALLGEPQYR